MTIRAAIAEAERLLGLGHAGSAIEVLTTARAIAAPNVDRYALGEALLRASNCQAGWDLYDLHPSRTVDRLPIGQRWDGKPCAKLVLIAEQGFGDAIQFLRFVPYAAAHVDQVVLAVHDELLSAIRTSPLLTGIEIIAKSHARTVTWPPNARWERLMSLPKHMDKLAVAMPIAGYLNGSTSPLSVSSAPQGMWNVGVAWRSTPRHGFSNRSIPRKVATQLAATGRLRPIVLHRDQDLGSLPWGAVSVGIRDFADTAAVIAQCRYVVTSDTVTAHLAPALGVPTIICLRHLPDWRWGAPASPTNWYDSARLMFQKGDEQWPPVLEEAVRAVLTAMEKQ
ncbi:hypothetical protein [Catenulispora rubra]|uniref:hypothetical protein n=1 Tax=Catenulispora rubra TaxID=280293 RepID=UPI0018924F57|nr:hypothetical protein [Catenulispora rubra]